MSDANAPEPQVPPVPPTPPAAAPAPAPAGPLTPENDRQLAMWAHIGGILFLLPSLIIWLMFKDRGPVTAVEAKEAVNWQITFAIVYVGAWILTFILAFIPIINFIFGWGLLPLAVWVLNVVWSVMGGIKVNGGGSYRYPINFRFIK